MEASIEHIRAQLVMSLERESEEKKIAGTPPFNIKAASFTQADLTAMDVLLESPDFNEDQVQSMRFAVQVAPPRLAAPVALDRFPERPGALVSRRQPWDSAMAYGRQHLLGCALCHKGVFGTDY